MPDYQQGKIYKLICPHTDKIYIGSTTKKYLSQRLTGHKTAFNFYQKNGSNGNTRSYELLQLGDVEIILLEAYPCNSKDELIARERHWIDQNNNIVNKSRPLINEEERKQHKKQYYEIKKEYFLELQKQKYENNKEHYSEIHKQYRINNQEKIKEQRSIEHICECGVKYTHSNKTRHEKSEKHQTYLMIQTL